MICKQCGALIDDDAPMCDNCGMKFEADEKEIAREFSSTHVPAIMEELPKKEKPRAKISNPFSKIISIVAAGLCLWLFFNAAGFMNVAIASSQGQSFMGGIFGSSSIPMPAEVFAGLREVFKAMGVSFAAILLILGFKKN